MLPPNTPLLSQQHAMPVILDAAGHFYNGFTWRLKLTVKPPDTGSPNDMNIHVGLCWGVEVEGEGALPLAETTMVQVGWQYTGHGKPGSSAFQLHHVVSRLLS